VSYEYLQINAPLLVRVKIRVAWCVPSIASKWSRLRKGGLAFDLVDFLVDACVGRGGR
jgi:hypothetical protein